MPRMLAGALLVAAIVPPPPALPTPRLYTIEQLMASEAVGGASFSADGRRVLFHSNRSGVFNVYTAPVIGGAATALTRSTTASTYAVSYFPQDDRALLLRDQGGNQVTHIHVRETDGQERDLTPGATVKASFHGWTRKGDAFYVASNERDPRVFDLYRHDSRSYARTLFFRNDTGSLLGSVSGDARFVAVWRPRTSAYSDLAVWDSVRRQRLAISPPEADAWYEPVDFDPSGRFLYYLTNDGSEFTRLRRCDVAAGRHEDVERADWDIARASFSPGGQYRATTINAEGRTLVRLHDTRSGREVALPELPADIRAVVVGRTEDRLAFYASSDRGPSDLYAWVFGEKAPRRLTDSLSRHVAAADLVESVPVRFASFDGLSIPALLWKPRPAAPDRKAPALVWVPGGPGGQVRKGWNPLIQYLVNHGYAVLGVNHRGSSGFGKAFSAADDQKHGREPLRDCLEARKYLSGLPWVDASRVGIIGGSYGGFMVLAALAFAPEEFAAGVDMFGISNWIRTLESVPAGQEATRVALFREMGDPATQREMLMAISPLFHAARIKRPLIVLHGANDSMVPRAEPDEIVAAVRRNGVPVEYVVFPDEGHGFHNRQNEADGYSTILDFLDRHLKGDSH